MDDNIVNRVLDDDSPSTSELEPFFGEEAWTSSIIFITALVLISWLVTFSAMLLLLSHADFIWSFIPLFPDRPIASVALGMGVYFAVTIALFWMLFSAKSVRYRHKLVVCFTTILMGALLVPAVIISNPSGSLVSYAFLCVAELALFGFAVMAFISHRKSGAAPWVTGKQTPVYLWLRPW